MTSSEKAPVKEKPTPEKRGTDASDKTLQSKDDAKDSATNLSRTASTPGDASSLNAFKPKETASVAPLLGRVEITETRPEEKPGLKPEAIKKAAADIDEALHQRALWGWGWGSPDAEKVRNILEPMSQADRKALEKEYEIKTGHKLRADLKDKLGSDSQEAIKIESILNRVDGKSDEAGQISAALAKVEEAGKSLASRDTLPNRLAEVSPMKMAADLFLNAQDGTKKKNAEADLRKTLGSLTSDQIKELKETYKTNYGVDLQEALLSNQFISKTSRDALEILFKGVDKRTGSDPESIKNALDLAQVGLDGRDVDIFKDAMQSASLDARKTFAANNGSAEIEKAFSGDEREQAKSYLERCGASLGQLIEGDSHWYHTNKDEITRLVSDQASDLDRQQFSRGRLLVEFQEANKGKEIAFTDLDRRDMAFYQRIHDGLSSAGNAREVEKWEAKLMKSEAVVSQILDSHNDGGWFGWGANTDRNKLMSSVENLSKEDWQRLKADPNYELFKVQKALDTFASPNERDEVLGRLIEKVRAKSYEESKTVGRRSIEETFADNKYNPGNRIDRIAQMSDAEKQAYRTNKDGYADKINALVDSQSSPAGMDRFATQRLLQEIKEGKQTDHVDQAILSALKGENPASTIKELEQAFKENPELLKRPANSAANGETLKYLRQAMDSAIDKAGYGEQYVSSGGEGPPTYIPGRQEEFADKLFKTGTMPIELKVLLEGQDKLARFNDIINASEEEKKRLLTNPAPDAQTKRFQDSVLGSDDDKQILRYAIQQGKLTDADTIRAYVKGSQTQPEEIKDILSKMSPEQRQSLANEYFSKYGSLISVDLISKVPDNERFRCRELLGPTETHVRQIAMDAREEGDRHTSVFDPVMAKLWDKSQLGAVEAQANMDKFIKDHAAEIDKLSPEQKKQFTDAVSNYQAALKNYVDSKGALAETVVDAAITVAAVGGSFFTGGTSLTLLATIGASGAAFRVAAMKAIQGTDFKDDPENYFRQSFKGLLAADLGFIGPQQLGLNGIIKVGEGTALRTAEGVIGRVSRQGVSETVFRESKEATQNLIARELAQVSRQGAIITNAETQAIVQRVSAEALKDGASPAEKALFEQALRGELKDQVVAGLRNKVMNEAEAYLLNLTTATAANAATELASTGVGLEDPNTLFDRVVASMEAGAVGASVFHFGFKAIGAAFHGTKAILGKDSSGLYAGEGTMVRHEDGSTTVVKEGEKYRFRQGDKIVENLEAQGPPARDKDTGVDGRPDNGRRDFIQDRFQQMDERTRAKARDSVTSDLKEVKAGTGSDGKPLSVYDKLMSDPNMTDAQKDRVINLLADVREHYASYRTPDGKMLPDQEVNWIHTQGELAKVIASAQANKLTGLETENALIASMFSDSAKFTETALTKGNFTTHHLDGALAAAEVLQRRGFPPERIQAITQAIREHQIAPPEFMGFIYQTTIARGLKSQLDGGGITRPQYDAMKKVLDDMTVVGKDGLPRIKQIADINNAPLVKNGNGEWEVAFTPEQREVLRIAGSEHWYLPHDPRYLADGKTLDPEFGKLPETEQARRLSTYKSSRALIDGDGIDNYATVGGASKIVKIRGPETFFPDKTVWKSVESIDTSYNDAFKVLTPEGQKLAQEALADRNLILNDAKTGIKAQMDEWLKAQRLDPSSKMPEHLRAADSKIPYYDSDLKYPQPLDVNEQSRLNFLKEQKPSNPAEQARIDQEIRSLKFKGMNENEIQDFEYAKTIRDKMTDFMRMAHRTDGTLPGDFQPAINYAPAENVKHAFSPATKAPDLPPPSGEVKELSDGSKSYTWKKDGRVGEVRIAKDGTTTISDDTAHSRKTFDPQGRLTSFDGHVYSYDKSGKLNQVLEPDGTELYTSDGKNWRFRQSFHGQINEGDLGYTPFAVDADGTLRSHFYGDVLATNADGTRTTFRADGRVEYEKANYSRESLKSKDLIEQNFPKGARQERVQELLKEFEERAKPPLISENEKALFYQQINRLLADTPGAALSQAERLNLAEQVIHHAARPSTVDQGMNGTCNVTTVENRLYTREPSKMAQIVADASLSGTYTMHNGQTVDLRQLSGGLKPDYEARQSLKLQEKGKAEVKHDGARDWASQLVERTLANTKWKNESVLVSGDKMLWASALGYDSSGVLRGKITDELNSIAHFYDKDGNLVHEYKPDTQYFNKDKTPIKDIKPEDLVYDRHGYLMGSVDKSKITPLFDAEGKPLAKFGDYDKRAFDKNGKVILERITPQYDKVGGGTLLSGTERVYYDQMGKQVSLKDYWNRKMDSPTIYSSDLHNISTQVTGHGEDPFVIVRAKETATASNQLDVATVEDFGKTLEKLQSDNNLPAVIMVHTSFPPFSTGLDAATGFLGGWHVVNVQGYDPVSKTIKYSNQWGSAADRETKGVPIDVLFRSMQDPLVQRAYKRWKYGS